MNWFGQSRIVVVDLFVIRQLLFGNNVFNVVVNWLICTTQFRRPWRNCYLGLLNDNFLIDLSLLFYRWEYVLKS